MQFCYDIKMRLNYTSFIFIPPPAFNEVGVYCFAHVGPLVGPLVDLTLSR